MGAGERITSKTTNTTEDTFQPCGVFTGILTTISIEYYSILKLGYYSILKLAYYSILKLAYYSILKLAYYSILKLVNQFYHYHSNGWSCFWSLICNYKTVEFHWLYICIPLKMSNFCIWLKS